MTTHPEIGYNAGAATRFDANLEAIRTLKQLQREQRQATPQEQAVLARYSGFGDSAFEQAFDKHPYKENTWTERGNQLRALVTEPEYQAIEKSRINAFYTTPEIINSMWSSLNRMGVGNLSRPRILEPSAGSGRFLGFEPKDLAARSDRTAVELDSMTGQILKQLYPESTVYAGIGYQDAPIRKNSQDVAISNVPFGNIPVFDKDFRHDRRKLSRQIHNYFFAKSVDNLRDGGVVAFITTHNTLDAKTAKPIRDELAKQADFIGAFRLPKGAFPDTEVVTDIIFMRKRLPTDKAGDTSWTDTAPMTFKTKSRYGGGYEYDVTQNVNKYFIDHPEMVLGKHSISGSQYHGDEYSVEPDNTTPLSFQLDKAVKRLPQNIIVDRPYDEAPRYAAMPTGINASEQSRVIGTDGHIYIKRGDKLVNADMSAANEAKVKSMLAIRDAAHKVLDTESQDKPDSELSAAQKQLNELYDSYVTANGPLGAPANSELLDKDPDAPFLKALETNLPAGKDKKTLNEPEQHLNRLLEGKEKVTAKDIPKLKTPFFSERVIHGLGEKAVSTDIDADTVVKNEVGRLDIKRIAALLGRSEAEVAHSLSAKGLIYKNPLGDWEAADQYLTGDVRDKLRIAERAASADPEYKPNVEALRKVQPVDLTAGQISVKLGTAWVPVSDVNAFCAELLNTDKGWHRHEGHSFFEYNKVIGRVADW